MNKQELTKLPIFFIVGRPRSGTTLLRTLFDAHPNVNIPLETLFPLLMHSKYGKVKMWDNKKLTNFYTDLHNQPQLEYWTINNKKLFDDIINVPANIGYPELCKLVYLNYISFYQKSEIQILGDKNPRFSLSISLLTKVFPEAKFIHLIRDYRDNILSIQKVDFEGSNVASLATRWVYYQKKIELQKAKNKFAFYTLKYEDLVSLPEKYLHEMCNFLGVPYHEGMLKFLDKKEEIEQTYSKESIEKYHSSLMKPITTDNIDVWKRRMKEKDIRIADVIAGAYAENYGYKRKYKYDFLIYLLHTPGVFIGKAWYWLEYIVLSLPFSIKMVLINFWNKNNTTHN